MSSFVFIPMPAFGHVNPTLAMAGELVRRGHRVTYFVAESFRDAVRATGADFVGYEDDGVTIMPRWKPGTVPPIGLMADRMLGTADRLAEPLVALLSTVDPDLVVYENMALWATYAVAGRNKRAAQFSASYLMNRDSRLGAMMRATVEQTGRPMMDPVRTAEVAAKYGAIIENPDGFFLQGEPLTLVLMPADFHPDHEALPASVHFVGPQLDGRGADSDFDLSPLGSERALFISLGTLFNDQAEFYRTCMKAFGDAGPVVLATGKRLGTDDFPDAPPNFLLAPYVPQLRVLERSRVFITHGGMNSTMEGLANGVPLVAVPQMIEQEMTARRIAELGLGVHVPPAEATADRLAEAVATVDTQAYRERVAKMRHAALAAGGATRAADLLVTAAR
jgi:MGT family glycosyltransferase